MGVPARGHMPFDGHRTVAQVDSGPARDVWVLAHWSHMVNTHGSLSRFGGWFPSRLRARGWQAKFGSQLHYPVCAPSKWRPLSTEGAR